MDKDKLLVTSTRSIFSFALGFQQFGYIAIMLNSGLTAIQTGLILSSGTVFTVVFLFLIFARSHFKYSLSIAYAVSAQVFLVVLVYPHIFGFFLNSVLIGLSNGIFTSVVVQLVRFNKKELSLTLALSLSTGVLGIGYYALSFKFPLTYLLIGLYLVLLLNAVVSIKIPIKSRDLGIRESLKSVFHPYIVTVIFAGAYRGVILGTLLPLILYQVLSINLNSLTYWYMLITVAPIPFLLFSYKLPNKAFVLISVMIGILALLLSRADSLFYLIILVVLLQALYALRGPVSEYALIKYVKGSTRAFSGMDLLSKSFIFISMQGTIFIFYIKEYYLLFVLLFVAEVVSGILVYRMLTEIESPPRVKTSTS